MNETTKKYLKIGVAIVLGAYLVKYAIKFYKKPTAEQESMFDNTLTLEKGSTGSEVAELQRILKYDFGKNIGATGVDKDGVDGDFGALTETALMEVKKVKKITLNEMSNAK
jgi:peptidoglycan hydrolase-like protein with peptidoglycan-binding domain